MALGEESDLKSQTFKGDPGTVTWPNHIGNLKREYRLLKKGR